MNILCLPFVQAIAGCQSWKLDAIYAQNKEAPTFKILLLPLDYSGKQLDRVSVYFSILIGQKLMMKFRK